MSLSKEEFKLLAAQPVMTTVVMITQHGRVLAKKMLGEKFPTTVAVIDNNRSTLTEISEALTHEFKIQQPDSKYKDVFPLVGEVTRLLQKKRSSTRTGN